MLQKVKDMNNDSRSKLEPVPGDDYPKSDSENTIPLKIGLAKLRLLWRILLLAFGFLLLTLLTLSHLPQISQAQTGSLELTKTLNNSSPVVKVGDIISFTITLTNNASFTLTHVTLVDDYNQNVLGFVGAVPLNDLHDPATGLITWTNVASPPIALGQTLTFTLFFTAEHPQTLVVNFAKAQDITGTKNALSDTQAVDQVDETTVGGAPISKFLSPSSGPPQTGFPVTFTHIITNDGAAFITFLPLTDTYDPAFLQFNFAIPTPTITSPPGLLVWADLTTYFGNITPFQSIVITTVFTATAQGGTTINQASIEGARDEFNNDLTAAQDQVPITIVGDTPTPTPTVDSDDEDDNTPAPTPTSVVIVSVDATPTAVGITEQSVLSDTNAPRYLPETGNRSSDHGIAPFFCLTLLVGGWFLAVKKFRG